MKKESHFEKLQKSLEAKKTEVLNRIQEKHAESLDWLKSKGLNLDELRENQVKRLAAATATGILMLAPGSVPLKLPEPQEQLQTGTMGKDVAQLTALSDPGYGIAAGLKEKLGSNDEAEIENFVKDSYGIPGKYELNGHRMNLNVGLIGAEQHLYRWPGDSVDQHVNTSDERAMFLSSGIAPNRGAYGYFGNPNDPVAIERERYYFAVETFLSPNWSKDQRGTYDFFRFRKMMAINTKTGQAVVGVVGDAGPAAWTGKSYGGSPEIMQDLGLGGGPRKGEILILFVDDGSNTIPLGPVKIGQALS